MGSEKTLHTGQKAAQNLRAPRSRACEYRESSSSHTERQRHVGFCAMQLHLGRGATYAIRLPTAQIVAMGMALGECSSHSTVICLMYLSCQEQQSMHMDSCLELGAQRI